MPVKLKIKSLFSLFLLLFQPNIKQLQPKHFTTMNINIRMRVWKWVLNLWLCASVENQK